MAQSQPVRRGEVVFSVIYPNSRGEFEQALSLGYPVVTTPEQRDEWGYPPLDDAKVVPVDVALAGLTGGPDDPVHEDLDPQVESDPLWTDDDPNAVTGDRLDVLRTEERRLGGLLSMQAPKRDVQLDGLPAAV